ncbi:MAG: MobA/MobL family protein, partial [Atopobiaceae bacterium]
MAIFHLNVRGVSLSRGSSAVKSAAYQSGEALTRTATGERCRYGRSERVDFVAVVLPDGAPEALRDREALWNAAEAAEMGRQRGGAHLVARRVEVAIPAELSRERAEALVMGFARHAAERGHAADVAIHGLGTGNPHAHILESELGLSGSYDPDSPSSAFSVPNGPRNEKRYLCRNAEGNEEWLTPEEWRPVKAEWSKVYNYEDGTRRTKAEARAAGLNPTKD